MKETAFQKTVRHTQARLFLQDTASRCAAALVSTLALEGGTLTPQDLADRAITYALTLTDRLFGDWKETSL